MSILGAVNINFYTVNTDSNLPKFIDLGIKSLEGLSLYLIRNPDTFIFYGKKGRYLNVFKTPPLKTNKVEILDLKSIKKVKNVLYKYSSPPETSYFEWGSRKRFICPELPSGKLDSILYSSLHTFNDQYWNRSFFYDRVAVVSRNTKTNSITIRGVNISRLKQVFSNVDPEIQSPTVIDYLYHDFYIYI